MKIKKIVALVLTCALTISPLNNFAFANKEEDLIAEINHLKNQKKLSETDKKALKAKVEDLVQKNEELKEKIEKLSTKNKKLKVERLSYVKEYTGAAIKIADKIICAVFLFYPYSKIMSVSIDKIFDLLGIKRGLFF